MRFLLLALVNLAVIGGLAGATAAGAAATSDEKCRSEVHKITGKLVKCILAAEGKLAKGGDPAKGEQKITRCEEQHQRAYDKALDRFGENACPQLGDSAQIAKAQVETSVERFTDSVSHLVSGGPPAAEAGKLKIYNGCSLPVKLMSPSNPSQDGMVLQPLATDTLDIQTDLHANAANTFLVAPVTTAAQCTAVDCTTWTDIQPATDQREGFMWDAPNLLHAAYCQPTNAAADQCTSTSSTPCCGPHMNFDRTFGTLWEVTPFGNGGSQDFVDLSTNYGSGPMSPPNLCPVGAPDNCVIASANIFYNVPIEIEMSGGSCACGVTGTVSSLSCTQASCPDAYTYPEDDKQCACSSLTANASRGYVVTYCPSGSSLPAIPSTP